MKKMKTLSKTKAGDIALRAIANYLTWGEDLLALTGPDKDGYPNLTELVRIQDALLAAGCYRDAVERLDRAWGRIKGCQAAGLPFYEDDYSVLGTATIEQEV